MIWRFAKKLVMFVFFLLAVGTISVVGYTNKLTQVKAVGGCSFPTFNCGPPCPFGICFTPPPPPASLGPCTLALNASPTSIGANEVATITITSTPSGALSGGTWSSTGNPASYTFSSSGTTATVTASASPSPTGVIINTSGWTVNVGGQTTSCSSGSTRVNVGGGITSCQLSSSGPGQMLVNQTASVYVTSNVPIVSGTLTATVSGAGSGGVSSQSTTGGTVQVTSGSSPGTIVVSAGASSSNGTGACRSTQQQIAVQPLPTPPPPPGCPSGSIALTQNTATPGSTVVAYAPAGWSNGSFISSASSVASVGTAFGNSTTVYANNSGTTSISGSGWRAPNGATGCYLLGTFLTVSGTTPSVSLTASTPVAYGDVSSLSWTASNVNAGNSCTASSNPVGAWSGSYTSTGTNVQSNALTANTTFTITCTHPSGTVSDSKVVTVTVPTLSCTPASQTVGTGAGAGVSASGGVAPYTWTASGGSPASGTGAIFSTTYATTGSKTITVTDSASQTANCSVTVSSSPGTATVTLTVVSPVNYNSPTTLSWLSSNTSSCTGSSNPAGFWSGTFGTISNGVQSNSLTAGPISFTIVCTSSSGGAPASDTKQVTVLAAGSPTGWITGANCSVPAPGTTCTSDIQWGTQNLGSQSAQVTMSVDPGTGTYGSESAFYCAASNPSPPTNTATLTVDQNYKFKLYAAADCNASSLSGSSGNVILLWDGAGSAPSGWTCISCSVGDPFYGVFPRASDTYGTTGGSDTHSHQLTYQSSTSGATVNVNESTFGGFAATGSHTHTWGNPISTIGSSLPPYKHLKLIKSNTPPSQVPAGAIAMFDNTVPSGWTAYSSVNGLYLRGANDTATGGSASHTHTFTDTSSFANPASLTRTSSNIPGALDHNHTVNGTLTSDADQPPYVNVVFAKANANTPFVSGVIGMFDATPSAEWNMVSTSSSVYYQRLLVGSNTFGATGGSATHSHGGTITATSGIPSANSLFKNGFSGNGSDANHTHNVTYSVAAASSWPVYKDIILAKYAGAQPLATAIVTATQSVAAPNLSPSNKDILAVRGNNAPANDPNTLNYTRNDANISAVTPILDGETVKFGINLVNATGSSPQTSPILVYDLMYNMAPLDGNTVNASASCVATSKCTMTGPTITYDSVLNILKLAFTITPTAGGLVAYPGDVWTIQYTVKTKATPGSGASVFRFLNAACLGTPCDTAAGTTDYLTTPAILFYKDYTVPQIQERSP